MLHTFAEVKLAYTPKFKATELPQISASKDAFDVLYPLFDQDTIAHSEAFIVVFLNKANRPIGWKTLSQGGSAGTVVDLKILLQYALLMNAAALIVAHNHPSGSLLPSQADIELTRRMKKATEWLDMPVLDHLIVTYEGTYYSFADQGAL